MPRRKRRRPRPAARQDGAPADKTATQPTPATDTTGQGQNGKPQPLVLTDSGVKGPLLKDVALVRRSVREGWPLTEGIRQAVVERMHALVQGTDDPRIQCKAASVLIAADANNLRREEQALTERLEGSRASTALLREALASPEARELLLALSDRMVQSPSPAD